MLDGTPEPDFPEDGLPGHREWAAKVADALAEEVRMPRGHEWPAGAERPVGDLAADPEEAEGEWAKAAGAADADTYLGHAGAGRHVTDPYVSVTARHALGLATTPPEYDEEAGRDTDGGGMKV
ncbi:hypothetical protein [Streptomyces caelestis]|uniref:hypothetical protein n=1 Tax=Streptomyces caelestis TaxID=36816 RepID=UPI00365CA120